jgi:hypothetical protein
MKDITGVIEEHLTVDSPTTLNGSLSAGATVRAGQQLIVKGTFTGPLTIEKDAFCTVYGVFGGTIEPGEGLAMLYGVVNTAPSEAKGKVAVGINSLVRQRDGRTCTLLADGSLVEASEETTAGHHTINGGELCVYLPPTGEFSPVPLGSTGS